MNLNYTILKIFQQSNAHPACHPKLINYIMVVVLRPSVWDVGSSLVVMDFLMSLCLAFVENSW